MQPVLLVHGIWHDHRQMERLRAAVQDAGAPLARGIDLLPNNGSVPIEVLARQVEEHADEMLRETRQERIDVVGFSMGALVSRTFIQRLSGREKVRRFVSLSGPHAGTFHARMMPLAGARDMRPGSELLQALAADPDPWGNVEVHTMWTPLDLMIVPPRSSALPRVKSEKTIRVALHALVPSDVRVCAHVIDVLQAP